MKKATMAAMATLAAGIVAAGGLWTHEVSVGTNGVTLAASPASEWRIVDAVTPSNIVVAATYRTAATNDYAVGVITNGALKTTGAAIPPVQGGAKLLLKAAAAAGKNRAPLLLTVEGTGLKAE